MSIIEELGRRKVFRVGAVYALVAWLLIQVAATVFPQLALPDWAPRLVTVIALVGFPIALVLAWAFELSPEGVRVSAGPAELPQPQSARGRGLDYALLAGLLVVAAATLWSRSTSTPAEPGAAPTAAVSAPTIAVLPFADMSASGDQAYFGDGIAEELLNALTRLDGLRVAGRTSSFAFKDSEKTAQEIGAALGVGAILEGSVRKEGNRLRVTAQLIDAADGYHRWSQTYDREFSDIFAIQDEIAAAVTGELGVRLGLGDVNTFQGAGTKSVEAYEAYLKGNEQFGDEFEAAIRFFDRAIELDPNYAAAYSNRGLATASTMWQAPPAEAPAILDVAFGFVERAVALDPRSAQAQSFFGTISYARFDWSGGHEAHQRALTLLSDRSTLQQFGNLLMRAGRLEAASVQYDAAEAAEPMGGRPSELRYAASIGQGELDEARRFIHWPNPVPYPLAELAISLNGDDREAVRTALATVVAEQAAEAPRLILFERIQTAFDDPAAARAGLRAALAEPHVEWPAKFTDIAVLAAWFGDAELALSALEKEARFTVVRLGILWYPVMADVRRLPGFNQLVTDINLVSYWRQYGWADQCRPLDKDTFSCG